MVFLVLRTTMALVSLAAFVTFGWGTLQQIKGQAETNKEMKQVANLIKQANTLTTETVKRVTPLVETAATLQTMNGELSSTARLLSEMNMGLRSVTQSEGTIVANLTSLNKSIVSTKGELAHVSSANSQLVDRTGNMRTQVQAEYGSIQRMNGLSHSSISELRSLNKKFSILRALP